jgi:hypothetical protein
MSEMASWFKTKDGYIFLTDEDVIAYHENMGSSSKEIDWNDFVGHGGLMQVFRIPDRGQTHHEGFVDMPDVIRKTILDGKMDMLFAHAGNLREATPEFIPLMERLANRFPKVKSQLRTNPFRVYKGKGQMTNLAHMKVGVERGFKGSTIGQLLRHPSCQEASMLVALKGASDYMDEHCDYHHYHNIIHHPNVTRKVLQYILRNISHSDVKSWALNRLKKLAITSRMRVKGAKALKIKTIKRGKAKIRMAV